MTSNTQEQYPLEYNHTMIMMPPSPNWLSTDTGPPHGKGVQVGYLIRPPACHEAASCPKRLTF